MELISHYFLKCIYVYLSVYMCVCVCVCNCGTLRGQKRALDIPELELQEVVSCPIWVLKTKFKCYAKALYSLNL